MTNFPIFIDTFSDLVGSCISFYEENKNKASFEHIRAKRAQLSVFAEAFHKDAGTLTASVQKRIANLKNGNCIVLMTAHQPNFFAYSGVLRKATLNFVLAKKLEELLEIPVVNFFGIADQDFTDDRWVKSALLPDVERRNGVLELRFDMPEKILLNEVVKPSTQVLNDWRVEIEKWFASKLGAIERYSKAFRSEFNWNRNTLAENFGAFWAIVEGAFQRAEVFSDFNAFVMSKIINAAWGYDTLFSRFSDCQQIFEDEFAFLLSHMEQYSNHVKVATANAENASGGVYENEHETIPFWYHCDCGSKARLIVDFQGAHIFGRGECLKCNRKYQLDFGPKVAPEISGIMSRVSARSLSMPLVFFGGLNVTCYVGGAGGREYLRQAAAVAQQFGISFPPVAIWRPKDVYFGVGRLEALLIFRRLSSSFDLSELPQVKAALEDEITCIKNHVEQLELCKKELAKNMSSENGEAIKKIMALSKEQNELRKKSNFASMNMDLKLLNNISAVESLYPCIVDYAVNVGLKTTSAQWIAFLKENGQLSSDVPLKTEFTDFALSLQRLNGM